MEELEGTSLGLSLDIQSSGNWLLVLNPELVLISPEHWEFNQ